MPTLDLSCPWEALVRSYPPNVKWCEAPLCGWIREPANTWSNLAYLLAGLWMWVRARRQEEGRVSRTFGLAAVGVGVASFFYHASTIFPTQLLDFAGMYAFAGLPLLLNLFRLGLLRERLPLRLYLLGVLSLTVVTAGGRLLHLPIQALVLFLVLAIVATEARLGRRVPPVPRRWFYLSLAALGLASLASVLDVSRLACDPSNHVLQGHAAWHVLSALSLVLLCRFYEEIRV